MQNKTTSKRLISGTAVIAALLFAFLLPIGYSDAMAQATDNLSGIFSIGPTIKVHIAPGNLQYQASTSTWRFAPNPWDICGTDNNNISPTYDGWIDLFGWGTGDNPTKATNESSDYPAFNDWGHAAVAQEYVLFQRRTASKLRWAMAKVNGVNGVILLPDNWKHSAFNFNYSNETNYDIDFDPPASNVISASEWDSIFASAGAVFLPAAGSRTRKHYDDGRGMYGLYWSSTEYYHNAKEFLFYDELHTDGANSRYEGLSVRLVCPVK